MALDIPNTFTQQTKAKASEVNANFDAIQAWADALALGEGEGGLLLADLPSGSGGQLIVCNSSGVPQYRTPSGSVAVSDAGAFSTPYYFRQQSAPVNVNINGSSWLSMTGISFTPTAGTYVIAAKVRCGGSANADTVQARLVVNGSAVDGSSFSEYSQNDDYEATHFLLWAGAVSGAVDVQGVVVSLAGTHPFFEGALIAIRVA